VFRGINHQHIFEDESDYNYFLKALRELKAQLAFDVHAYCLMSNHVHLIFREKQLGDISLIMKRLLTKYAMYFNRKYQRSGALIASRYKSVPIEADEYLIPLQRYIHQNPLKAGLVIRLEDYLFSSYKEFLVGGELVDPELTLGMVGRNEWIRIQQVPTDESFDISGRISLSDEEVRQKIMRSTNGKEPHEIGSWAKPDRDFMLRKLKEEGLSIRQIERATGISRGIVAKS
jgi:REP element-mobilizing transposase RayT